jgi:UDP-GlcNAc:undecaprenyl-phosphate GlcNAc-1-phosphate transferase
MIYFSTLLFSMFATLALVPILRRYAMRIHYMDKPCERKMHSVPVPRVGGIAMAVGALVPVLLWASRDQVGLAILAGAWIIVVFGIVDDVKELGYRSKFAAQLAAALVVILFGDLKIRFLGTLLPEGCLLPPWLAVGLTALVILGVTNAVNLSDGLDGLTGGIMLMIFICIGFLAYRGEQYVIALLAVAVMGAIFGFLRFNTYPATIFMGDAGSQLLGFLAVTMAVAITQRSTPLSPLFPLILLGLPIFDTLMVMTERMVNGRSPFLADRNHLHHKLLRLNLFHTEAVFIIYVMQAGLVTVAYLFRYQSEWALLLGYAGLGIGFMMMLFVAVRNGWCFNRPGGVDRIIKNRLKIYVKDRFLLIKISQEVLENSFILLMVVSCALPGRLPGYVSMMAIALVGAVSVAWLFRPAWRATVLRVTIYFFMPLVLYWAEVHPVQWIPSHIFKVYHLFFGVLVFFAVTTLRTTRRKEGFKVTPLEFILLFLAIVVPNLPDAAHRAFGLGFVATKIIVLFFVFEVLVGELRNRNNRLNMAVIVAIWVVAFKSTV